MDPSKIGRTIDISFNGSLDARTYTADDFQTDVDHMSDWHTGLQLRLYGEINSILDDLWDGGATRFLDGDKPILYGSIGADNIAAERAADFHYFEPYATNGVVIVGGPGNDSLIGDNGSDKLLGGEQDDSLAGGDQNDTLDGGAGTDVLDGGDGHDILLGGSGDDHLLGGEGNDELHGGIGRDVLLGQSGNDTLNGSDSSLVDLLIDGDGSDKIQVGAGDITVAYDEGDSLYYGDLLLGGGQAALHHDPDGVPSIAYYLGSQGEIYISGGTALYVVLPNSEGIVAVLGGGGLQFGDETANTVEAQYTVDPTKVAALDTALSNLLTDWGWDSETGDLGPTAPAAAPDTSAWDTATAASNIPLDPV